MKEYKIRRFGREFVLLCTEEDAKRQGLEPVERDEQVKTKQVAPANKGRAAANK